jgi:hypothetical protein
MTNAAEVVLIRPRGEDVERGFEGEGATEDVEPEREGESVEGGAGGSGVL